MHEEPGLISELEVAFDKRVASQWARDHYQPDLDLAEDEVREYFDTYFATVQFRLAAVRSEELARAIRQAVDSGGDLDSLAREHSVDKFSAAGGLHRLMSYRDLGPALRDVADSTAVGNIAGPFLYRGVYAVARVEQKVPADTNSYEATRPRIERWLKQQANAVQWDAFVTEQRRLHPMDVDPTLLAAIRSDSAALFTQEFSIGSDRTFIRIGEDVRMSDAEFRKQVAHGAMTAATTPFPELLERLLDETGEKLALIAAAYADGYHQRPSNVQAYDRTLDSALVELYVKETVVPRIKFRRAEFQEYYEEHAEDFRVPDQLQCDRMMADSESVALAVYERLQDGADFRYISRQFDVTVAPPEESAKWLAASTFPQAIQHDLEILRNGECLSPRLTDEGWLILRLKGRRRGEVLPLEQVETKIRAAIFQRKFNEELDSVISILKENSDIHFDEKAIEQYFGNDS
jgi:peptidyl-prolyl cis-trans isomerase C